MPFALSIVCRHGRRRLHCHHHRNVLVFIRGVSNVRELLPVYPSQDPLGACRGYMWVAAARAFDDALHGVVGYVYVYLYVFFFPLDI